MAITNPTPVETLDQAKLQTTMKFIEMLTLLQSFMANPQLLQQLGTQAAQAYAISTDMQAKHDALVTEALSAQASIAQAAQDTADLIAKQQAFTAQQAAAQQALNDYAASKEADYENKMQHVADQQASVDVQIAALTVAQAKLESDTQALAAQNDAQNAREVDLDAKAKRIADLRNALAASA
jgi:hypothetical protein